MSRYSATAGVVLAGLASGLLALAARAEPPAPAAPPPVPGGAITLEQAVAYGLQYNPQLAAVRQQHGLAEAGVVLARTYPFNPVFSSTQLAAHGPDVTNHR